ncbi:MAG: IS200/IS605 family transposase [Anaerolineae bacterium]|nr:IS200/IS605 family transposase [Anaerolineae bacterium]
MSFYRLFYHIVWATKNRQPLLTSEIEPVIYKYLRTKAIGLGGTVFAIGGIADHVHMAVSIPAKIAVATFIGQTKGIATARFNKEHLQFSPVYWQDGYGVFSVDGKRLPYIIAYIEKQKEHHAQDTTIPILEHTSDNKTNSFIQDPQSTYLTGEETWRQDMLSWEIS